MKLFMPPHILNRFKSSLNKWMFKVERGEVHLPVMRLFFQVHYLFSSLENTQTTPQTHAREIWIKKMGGRKGKRG